VNSVGFGGREIDTATVVDAIVAVESRESALAPLPAGALELVTAMESGVDIGTVAEIGELVAGSAAGRTSDRQITLYKSIGVAVQDTAAATLALAAAERADAGTLVSL
jgi:ornithine cyclodeaminase/alanine dehydrogenase-like protein (mu-crystallin family)